MVVSPCVQVILPSIEDQNADLKFISLKKGCRFKKRLIFLKTNREEGHSCKKRAMKICNLMMLFITYCMWERFATVGWLIGVDEGYMKISFWKRVCRRKDCMCTTTRYVYLFRNWLILSLVVSLLTWWYYVWKRTEQKDALDIYKIKCNKEIR